MQLRANRDDLNIYLSGNELLGIIISNKQSFHQERGWNAFLCLNELLSNQGLNIFPLPIGIYRDPIKLSIIFVFEYINKINIIQFYSLINSILIINLRKKPIIILTWCKQLYNMYHSLLLCTTGSLMRTINIIDDIFIRENGLLLFHNISFDTILPKNKKLYKSELLFMICNILSSALCISRIII